MLRADSLWQIVGFHVRRGSIICVIKNQKVASKRVLLALGLWLPKLVLYGIRSLASSTSGVDNPGPVVGPEDGEDFVLHHRGELLSLGSGGRKVREEIRVLLGLAGRLRGLGLVVGTLRAAPGLHVVRREGKPAGAC